MKSLTLNSHNCLRSHLRDGSSFLQECLCADHATRGTS